MFTSRVPPNVHFSARYDTAEISPELMDDLLAVLLKVLADHSSDRSGQKWISENFSCIIFDALVGLGKLYWMEFPYTPYKLLDAEKYLRGALKKNWPAEKRLDFFECLFDAYSPLIEDVGASLKQHNAPYELRKTEGYTRFHPTPSEAG